MSDTLATRHTVSGAIDLNTPRHIFEHFIFGRYLEEVDVDAKPYNPELYKPVDVDGNPVGGESALPQGPIETDDDAIFPIDFTEPVEFIDAGPDTEPIDVVDVDVDDEPDIEQNGKD